MKRFSWILALIAVLAMVFIGCPDPGSKTPDTRPWATEELTIDDADKIGALLSTANWNNDAGNGVSASKNVAHFNITSAGDTINNQGFKLQFPEKAQLERFKTMEVTFKVVEATTLTAGQYAKIGFKSAVAPSTDDIIPYGDYEVWFGEPGVTPTLDNTLNVEKSLTFPLDSPNKLPNSVLYFSHNQFGPDENDTSGQWTYPEKGSAGPVNYKIAITKIVFGIEAAEACCEDCDLNTCKDCANGACDGECGENCCFPAVDLTGTKLTGKLGATATDFPLTAQGAGSEVKYFKDNDGYQFTYGSGGYDGSWAKMEVTFDTAIMDYKQIKFNMEGIAGDTASKNVILLGATTLAVSADPTGGATMISTSGFNYTAGKLAVTLDLDVEKTAVLPAGKLELSIYERSAQTGGSGATTYQFSNIVFVPADLCSGCNKKPSLCTCIKPVTGIAGVPTAWLAKADLQLPVLASPATATNRDITWDITDADGTGATVDANGKVTGIVAAGTIKLTATVTDGIDTGTDYVDDTFEIEITEATDVTLTAFESTSFGYGNTKVDDNIYEINASYSRAGFTIGDDILPGAYVTVTLTYSATTTGRFGLFNEISNAGLIGGDSAGWVNLTVGTNQTATITISPSVVYEGKIIKGFAVENTDGATKGTFTITSVAFTAAN